jgi:hypothetical protein
MNKYNPYIEKTIKDVYYISEVYDGERFKYLKIFKEKKEFIKWFAKQSNYSMSGLSNDPDHLPKSEGLNNQRINITRIYHFLETER